MAFYFSGGRYRASIGGGRGFTQSRVYCLRWSAWYTPLSPLLCPASCHGDSDQGTRTGPGFPGSGVSPRPPSPHFGTHRRGGARLLCSHHGAVRPGPSPKHPPLGRGARWTSSILLPGCPPEHARTRAFLRAGPGAFLVGVSLSTLVLSARR